MSAKTYGTLMRAIAAALAALIAVSIVLELPLYVPVLGIIVALVLASAFRRLVKEIMTDERNRRIDEKATATSYRIYTIVTAMVVLTVLMLRSSLPSWVGIAGETLAYSLCGLMLVHLASRSYYGKKL
jgi:uncharacterized membrane protein